MNKAKWLTADRKRVFLTVLFSSLLIGFITHGVMLTNKFSNYDDIHNMFGAAATFIIGRWMLGIMDVVTRALTGGLYSTPLFNGAVSFVFLAASAYVVAEIFEIKETLELIVLCGLLITFPSLTGTFGYMFTAPFYAIGIFMTFAGAYLICKGDHKLWKLIVGALLISGGLGVYQAYFPFALCTMIIYMFFWTDDARELTWKQYIKEGMWYVCAAIASVIYYFVFMFISLAVTHTQLSEYKGVNTFGYVGRVGYLIRLIRAYSEFFYPSLDPNFQNYNMYPGKMRVIYYVVLICLAALVAVRIIHACRNQGKLSGKISKTIQLLFLIVIFPPTANLIFLMTREWFIYELITYGEVMIFVFLLLLYHREKAYISLYVRNRAEAISHKIIAIVSIAALICSCLYYCRLANICYLKEELMLSEATSYLTTLVTRIESTEGYTDELPVAFLNIYEKQDKNWAEIPELDFIHYEPYEWQYIVTSESWYGHLKYYCGYEPENLILDQDKLDEIAAWPEVEAMPNYPDDGAIQIINGTIVIKF